ncbi:hypothetical protein FF100_01155 [Methylobacterium terricola]|uniref:Uncharacterized protein n=1 Tax=Methylobacterium terricola TaxID=2583531 RepID=A0A5C4LNY2_9HYPH|nr:hypothetical protein [Methylobacterium terricola]TNC15903.1 hypothetical protein FF100_01155 [Methylobacterium terricola]
MTTRPDTLGSVGFDGSQDLQDSAGDGTPAAIVVEGPFPIGEPGVAEVPPGQTVRKVIDTGMVPVTKDSAGTARRGAC